MKTRTSAATTLLSSAGLHQHAEIAGEGLVARGAAERDAEENFVADLHRLAADVVGVLDRADESAAIVGDVELARQIVERAVVDDDLRHLVTERHHVDQLERIDAGGRIRGEVADVVRARAARVQADGLDAAQNLRRVLRLDEPHLKIRPRGDLHVAGGQFLSRSCAISRSWKVRSSPPGMRSRAMKASLFGVRKNRPFHLKRKISSLSGALFAAAWSSRSG